MLPEEVRISEQFGDYVMCNIITFTFKELYVTVIYYISLE